MLGGAKIVRKYLFYIMTKNRKGTIPLLLDLHYKFSANSFEEFYGDGVSYSEIEQTSYIDLKEMVFEKIGKGVKFRKFGRDGRVLTIKIDILPKEYELFLKVFNEEEVDEEFTNDPIRNPLGKTKFIRFNFMHDFKISNIRDLTNEEIIKFKKNLTMENEDDIDSIDDDVDLENIDDIDDIEDIQYDFDE